MQSVAHLHHLTVLNLPSNSIVAIEGELHETTNEFTEIRPTLYEEIMMEAVKCICFLDIIKE